MKHSWESLIEELCWWEHDFPKARMKRIMARLVDQLLDAAKEGHSITIPGLGTFSRATRKARTIRNPVTKELMQLQETHTVKFTAAKAAKERIK